MIVIGDVHGCYKTLLALLEKIPKDQDIVFVGDLIDRGPSSKDVVELVKSKYMSVMGNHEEMMINACEYDPEQSLWGNYSAMRDFIRNGGEETLKSYGIDWTSDFKGLLESIKNNPKLQEHLQWMSNMPEIIEFENVKNDQGLKLVVTHSSAHSVYHRLDSQDTYQQWVNRGALLWNRLPNIQAIPGVFNIFGHTPHEDNPRIRTCYANIDTGACYVAYKAHGVLTAIQYPEMIVYQQENLDMPLPEERK